MAHDVHWLSMCIDAPGEIAVHIEDGSNPDGSKAGNTGSRTWPCSCGASSRLVSPLGLASFGVQPISFCAVGADSRQKETPAEGRGLGSSD